jgi:hypothetical protein
MLERKSIMHAGIFRGHLIISTVQESGSRKLACIRRALNGYP